METETLEPIPLKDLLAELDILGSAAINQKFRDEGIAGDVYSSTKNPVVRHIKKRLEKTPPDEVSCSGGSVLAFWKEKQDGKKKIEARYDTAKLEKYPAIREYFVFAEHRLYADPNEGLPMSDQPTPLPAVPVVDSGQ